MTHEEEDGLQSGLGMSRRSLLRRGVVVGGTLMWTAPMVRSMTPAAFAARQGPSPGNCAACYCYSGPITAPTKDECSDNGVVGQRFSEDDCKAWCRHVGAYSGTNPATGDPLGAPGGPYEDGKYCSGLDACECVSVNDNDYDGSNNGVQCA